MDIQGIVAGLNRIEHGFKHSMLAGTGRSRGGDSVLKILLLLNISKF